MTSLCRQLSAQENVNWVTTADGCVHTADTTHLDSFFASVVCIAHNMSRLFHLGKALPVATGKSVWLKLHQCSRKGPTYKRNAHKN